MHALTLVCSLWSLSVPAVNGPVTDQAGVLSESEERAIGERLVALRAATTVQLAVMTIDSTAGQPIEDLAHAIAQAWGGGEAGQNNGALFLIAVRDRHAQPAGRQDRALSRASWSCATQRRA